MFELFFFLYCNTVSAKPVVIHKKFILQNLFFSVIGLNFDYLWLNLLGHSCYNLFNIGLFWIPIIQHQYFEKYPKGFVIPVQINDLAFSMHAVFATFVTVLQTFIYEKGDQRVSRTCFGFLILFISFLIVTLILSIVHVVNWLEYFYFISYVKIAITLIKCCPQAYFNYKRKSTVGWSIGNVLLDFTGGLLSILQMFIIGYNYYDWSSLFGDPTKFALGSISVLFDILFILQHYVWYRKRDETTYLIDSKNGNGATESSGVTNYSGEFNEVY